MPSITIGEYRDAAAQREFIGEAEIDLSSGPGEVALNPRTRSIRVCGDVAHRWQLGKGAKATDRSQRRPANQSEALDVMPGQGWSFSAVAVEDAGGSGELAMLLDVFSNAEKYKKALAEFCEREKAARAAEGSLKAARDHVAAAEAALAKREASIARREAEQSTLAVSLHERETAAGAREAALKAAEAQSAERHSARVASLDAREKALKPKELTLGRREAAVAKLEAQAKADADRAASLRAELEQKLALIRA